MSIEYPSSPSEYRMNVKGREKQGLFYVDFYYRVPVFLKKLLEISLLL